MTWTSLVSVNVDGLAQEERRQEMALQFCFPGRRMHMRMVLPLSSTEVQQRHLLNGSLSAIESSEQDSIPNTVNSVYYNVMPLTNEAEDEVKDDWYEQLQYEVSRVPQHDLLLIIILTKINLFNAPTPFDTQKYITIIP